MDEWIATLPEPSIGSESLHAAQAGAHAVVLLRAQGELIAYRDACPHEGFALSKFGERDADLIVCSMHLWEFDACNGKHVSRLNRPQCNLVRYPLRVVGGVVEVNVAGIAPAAGPASATDLLEP
jgi:toluene monooxygenase system ferredoxin subunit